MDVQSITYRGRIVAACTGQCFLLADDLAYRAPGDPEPVFVVAMCSYANDIARGLLPAPFNDADARRYARAFLIPEELLERPELDVERAAAALGVPVDELRAARAEHQCGRASNDEGDRPVRWLRQLRSRHRGATTRPAVLAYRGGQ